MRRLNTLIAALGGTGHGLGLGLRLGLGLGLGLGLTLPAAAADVTVKVFEGRVIHWDEDRPEVEDTDGFIARHAGQSVERTLELPPAPENLRDARRIVAVVVVEPIFSTDGSRPNDPWNRLGSVSVAANAPESDDDVELVRFITGYGGAGRFEQDVTPLAPFLHGRVTLRGFISTYSDDPGWKLSLTLRYTTEGVGQRRPQFARLLFASPHVSAASPGLSATIVIPANLEAPRVRITSTGHATDGLAGNEFLSCTHILRVDGVEVARWRPWAEDGGPLRAGNPWAGRRAIDGRAIWSSDFDRSGWHPGRVVDALTVPAPELGPGRHRVELEILGIRPKEPPNETGGEPHGYWVVTAIVVADEPWPEE